jgi:flagellar basal body rod protein FlgF
MNMKKSITRNLLAISVVAMLTMLFVVGARTTFAADAATKNLPAGSTWVVTENAKLSSLTIGEGATIKTPGKSLTMIADGVETAIKPGTYKNVELVITDKFNASPVGNSNRGVDNYRTAIYVDKTGLMKSKSVSQAVSGGAVTASSASNITINSTSDNFNGIMVNGGDYTIKDSTFNFLSKSDGSDVSDFNGYGAVISSFNKAKVTVEKVKIITEGVARLAFFTHDYSNMLVADSSFKVMGGTLYDGYVNSADTTIMVAPPWVLGITGSARGTNLEGTCSSFTVVRTDANAANWGVISTDGGSDMLMTVVDSTLSLIGKKDPFSPNYGSGYGTYILGVKEYFYGVTFNVGTYAGIFTNGDAVYASSKFEKPLSIYPLKQVPNGKTVTNFMGQTREGYDAVPSDTPVFTGITGLGRNTVVNSDVFGWMAHGNGNLTITDGTEVNAGNAVFLIKAGDNSMTVSNGAKINSKNNVIMQMIDNDDALVGVNRGSSIGLRFNTEFNEAKGYPGIDYEIKKITTDRRNTCTFSATNVELNGDLYNGTGYFGGQAADKLEVTLGKGASLKGVISATSLIHVDEKGNQNTHFTIKEYYYLGHVVNKMFYNGGNDVSVTLKDGAVWTVSGTGTVTGLTIGEGCKIAAPKGYKVTMMVDGIETSIKAGTYKGKIVLTVTKTV